MCVTFVNEVEGINQSRIFFFGDGVGAEVTVGFGGRRGVESPFISQPATNAHP